MGLLPAGLLLSLLLLAGCGSGGADDRAGDWHPSGANAGNLAATVAQPRDLIVGRGVGASEGRPAADAVERVRQDRPKGLLNVTTSGGSAAAGGGASGQN